MKIILSGSLYLTLCGNVCSWFFLHECINFFSNKC